MMLKQHIKYLRRVIGLAARVKDGAKLLELVAGIRTAKTSVYQMIRDIVCDSRFYSVIEDDTLWKNYSAAVIGHFIESLTFEDWQNDEMRTGKKEDFLNDWLARHIMPMSEEQQKRVIKSLKSRNQDESILINDEEDDADSSDQDIEIEPGITDNTNGSSNIGQAMPGEIENYIVDTRLNAAGMDSESHKADAQYLQQLEPSIVELAKKIGRGGGEAGYVSGRFQTASRNDISGITVGNDLNSLLPTELAMLESQQHIKYLRRVIGLAARVKDGAKLLELVAGIRTAKTSVYQMIRDIVCDSRFYSVIEDDTLWKNYSAAVIGHFIESLTFEDWQNDEMRTGKKEDFLNDWLARHIMPMSEEQQKRVIKSLKSRNQDESILINDEEDDADSSDQDIEIEPGITDNTNGSSNIGQAMPGEIENYIVDTRLNAAGMDSESHKADAQYLQQLEPSIVELAKKIGRGGGEAGYVSGRFQTASRSDISGITVGNDLNSLLPTELAMLESRSTESIFYQRFVQKRLQLFSSASQSLEKPKSQKGPIYICVDTSGSMTGEPEVIAKTLALAIVIVAQRDRRPACMINYSHNLSFFILTDFQRQRQKFLSFLSHSYGGGNDENRLFDFIFKKMPDNPRYRQLASSFEGADILLISDFEWSSISNGNKKLIAEARMEGMKFYGLGIHTREYLLDKIDDPDDDDWMDGYKFLKQCDYRYLYAKGQVVEYLERPRIL